MTIAQYGAAAAAGLKSIVEAAVQFPSNPLATQVNQRLWGRWWGVVLALLTMVAITAVVLLPSYWVVIDMSPPLGLLAFIPLVVRGLIFSVPALFAFVVVWRVRRLRSSIRDAWPDRASMSGFGGKFFDAGALPVAVATVVLAVCGYVGDILMAAHGGQLILASGGDVPEAWTVVGAAGRLAGTVLTVALVAGILSVHRSLSKGLGQLFRAGFFVWGAHIAIGFTVPWMVSWWAFLPVIGPYAAKRTPDFAVLLFDLAVVCAAWMAAREKCCTAPLWDDVSPSRPPPPPPPPPPSPPPPPPPDGDAEGGAKRFE